MKNAQKHLRHYSAREQSKRPGDNKEVDADAARASGAKRLALPMCGREKCATGVRTWNFPRTSAPEFCTG
jgi:hypothetical protein